jgi:hypothetical protein
VTVRVTLLSGEVKELYLGDMTPAGDTYYLMVKGDERVFTVRAIHGMYYHYAIRDLWEGAVATVDGTNIIALRLLRAGKLVVELKRTPELFANDLEFRGTQTSVVYPYTASPRPSDTAFLNTFARGLASLQSTVAVDAGAKSYPTYGLDKPAAELELGDAAGNRVHVYVGKQEGSVLFMRFETDPTVYAGDPTLLSLLSVEPSQFVSKFAVIVKLDDTDTITFQAGKTTHVLEVKRAKAGSEDGATWLVDGHSVPMSAFKDFFVAAVSLQVDSLYDGAIPSGAPDFTLSFTLNRAGGRQLVAKFVPYSQEFYAVVKGGKSDSLVNRQQVKFLLGELDKLVAAAGE